MSFKPASRQRGTVTVPVSGTATGLVAVTFPRQFPTTPYISLTVAAGSAEWVVCSYARSATGFSVIVRYFNNTAQTASVSVTWIAEVG